MTEGAVILQHSAIGPHEIQRMENVLAANGENETLGIVLAAPYDAHDVSILIEHRRAAVTGIGRNGDLAGDGITVITCLCA